MLIALYITVAFLFGLVCGLVGWHQIAMPKMERLHIAEMERMAAIALQYGNCEDCNARGSLFEKTNHHGGTKRVCRDRDACNARSRG